MAKTEVAVRDKPGELAGPASEPNLLTVIAAAVADPRIDVEKMERLCWRCTRRSPPSSGGSTSSPLSPGFRPASRRSRNRA